MNAPGLVEELRPWKLVLPAEIEKLLASAEDAEAYELAVMEHVRRLDGDEVVKRLLASPDIAFEEMRTTKSALYHPQVLHDQWTEMSKAMGGHLVIAVPSHDFLIYGNGATQDDRVPLNALARMVVDKAQKPMTATLFEWTKTGWQVVAP